MDPHPEKTSGLGLPQPSTEQNAASLGAHHVTHGREIHPITMEAPLLPFVPVPDPTAPVQATVPPQPMPILTTPVAADPPATAAASSADDDMDALDEEWVNKAKAIVERTKDDPYMQSKELNKAKAEYLRVRYSKEIKIDEEHK